MKTVVNNIVCSQIYQESRFQMLLPNTHTHTQHTQDHEVNM
jgi:hypothetical protein